MFEATVLNQRNNPHAARKKKKKNLKATENRTKQVVLTVKHARWYLNLYQSHINSIQYNIICILHLNTRY